MSEIVHCITTGRWRQNGYIVEGAGGSALVIDPGAEPERYIELLRARQLKPAAILNTHAHYDHIGGIDGLTKAYAGLPFYLHGADRALLRQANVYRSVFGSSEKIVVPDDFIDLKEAGERLDLGEFSVGILATPGHTNGGVCFVIESNVFTGDTLLPNGVGRTDLPGGAPFKIAQSVKMLEQLSGDLQMNPGHGSVVRLADALAHNPSQPVA